MLQLQHLTSGLNCSSVQTRAFRGVARQKTMDSGYPLDWFVSTPPQTFICEICGKILNTPKSTSCCGESFCCRCLEFWNDYYGICPKRCGELEMDSLRKENKLEKIIQSLPVYCQYSNGGGGCTTMITLAEKQRHERKCQYKPKNTTSSAQSKPALSSKREKNSSSSSVEKQDTYVEMASVAAKTREKLQQKHLHPSPSCSTALHIGVGGLAYHTYHLKRRTPGESLGFVLVAGAKNSNGRAVNFSIKTVNPGTVAAEAGLLPGDKILQVDNIGLSQLAQQDAISRIKDNPEVLLTVLRSSGRPLHHHVYEDIKSAEQEWAQTTGEMNERGGETDRTIHNMFLRHQLNVRDRSSSVGAGKDLLRRKRSDPVSDRLTLIPGGGGGGEAAYKSPTQTTVCSDPTRNHLRYFPEKVSADSGLSSSNSSFSPSPRSLSKPHPRPPPLHEVDHTSTDVRSNERRESRGEASPLSRDVRVEGGYEVEEIYLQKNGTNQLGITLGYDTTNPGGSLYVCEIIPSGLAAQDGRVKKGDIIRKVNGFEVYDPEEAILLFLEQDQDISLTVARKIKVFHHYRKGLMSSKSQNALHSQLNLRESCYHDDDEETIIRRTDSCGSLDSHSHIYRQRGGRERAGTGTEIRRGSESSAIRHLTASTNNMTISLSGGDIHGGGRERMKSPLVGTDHVFRPIMEGRPQTANQLSVERARGRREGRSPQHTMVHSSASIDSAPPAGRGGVSPHHNSPPVIVTRHHSMDVQRLQSVSPSKPVQPLLAYRPRDVITSNYRRGSGPDGFSPTGGPIGPINRHHSVGNVRCESLV